MVLLRAFCTSLQELSMPFKHFLNIFVKSSPVVLASAVKLDFPPAFLLKNNNLNCVWFNLHATLSLGVGSPELGLIQAIGTLCTVLLYQTAFAPSTAPGSNTPGCISTQYLPFSEPAAPPPPPPPPLDVFLRGNPLSPALISVVVVVVVIIRDVCNHRAEKLGKKATIDIFKQH